MLLTAAVALAEGSGAVAHAAPSLGGSSTGVAQTVTAQRTPPAPSAAGAPRLASGFRSPLPAFDAEVGVLARSATPRAALRPVLGWTSARSARPGAILAASGAGLLLVTAVVDGLDVGPHWPMFGVFLIAYPVALTATVAGLVWWGLDARAGRRRVALSATGVVVRW